MRKLMALIAVVGFAAQAQADNHFSQSGSYRLIYTNNVNAADFDEDNGADGHVKTWTQRTKLNTAIKAGDNVSAQVNLVHNAQWGQNALQSQYPSDVTIENSILVNEAYVNWMMNDQWSVRFGRGSFTMADGTVVSANEWEAQSKAFEGMLFNYDHEIARFGFFGVQGLSNSPASNESAEFWGITADFKSLPEWLKMASLHYIMVKSNDSTTGEADHTRIGVTLKGDAAGADYRLTYAVLGGEQGAGGTQDVDANMMDAELGYTMANVRNLRLSLGYHTDSGDDSGADDTGYAPFHYDRHNNAGLMDVVGWGNLTYMKIGATADISDSVKFGLAHYQFTATEEADSNVRADGTTSLRTAAADDKIGSELDAWVSKSYSSNFSVQARYGMFTPDDGVATDGDDNSLWYIEGNLTF